MRMTPDASIPAPPRPSHQPGAPAGDCTLTNFDDSFAPLIVGWVLNFRELTWLAPRTVPPLTAEKVIAWGTERRRRHLFWTGGAPNPVGYAELNEMPTRDDQMWIGHFILDPTVRGRGIGTQFARALIARAFFEFGARDVVLVVFPDNHNAIACYERAGMVTLGSEVKTFETTGRQHTFTRMGISRGRFEKLAPPAILPGWIVPYRDLAPCDAG